MKIARYLNHTVLNQDCLVSQIEEACKTTLDQGFISICVPPLFVKKTRELIAFSGCKVSTVIGYPFGYGAIESKVAEIVLAIIDGADELEMVVNISAIKNGDWNFIANEINTVLPIIKSKNKILKVIIESGILDDEEILKCCDIYGAAGVDYIKTSTGVASKGASIHDVQLIRTHLADAVFIEASGGIKSYSFAKELINAGANLIGSSNSVMIVEENLAQVKV
jgi:deoxyribose-phosphate aldolase